MTSIVVPVFKFVGTISLGLLTGVSYTTATQSVPSLFNLPSASAANSTFKSHQQSTQSHLVGLSLVPISAYGLAYVLSPREGGRHPYLLWTGLVVAIGSGVDYLLTRRDEASSVKDSGANKSDAEEYVDLNGSMTLNGEGIRTAMDKYRARKIVQASITGLAFAMGVIGIWGDGTSLRARTRA